LGPAEREKGRNGDALRSGPTGAVPGDRRVLIGSTRRMTFLAAPGIRHARLGEPRSAAAPLGLFLRYTGLPSRSALVAPPLRLATLRWRGAFDELSRSRPPPGVSTACSVAVARLSGRPFPGGAPLENVPRGAGRVGGTFSRTARPPVRAIPCSAQHVILGPFGAREGAHR
jgi:hypothetical protein